MPDVLFDEITDFLVAEGWRAAWKDFKVAFSWISPSLTGDVVPYAPDGYSMLYVRGWSQVLIGLEGTRLRVTINYNTDDELCDPDYSFDIADPTFSLDQILDITEKRRTARKPARKGPPDKAGAN